MSWHPQYRSSKFRHVYGKAASKDKCYDCVPITHSVHDNHFCAVNPHFVAVVTECAGGGAFLVIPIHQVSAAGAGWPSWCWWGSGLCREVDPTGDIQPVLLLELQNARKGPQIAWHVGTYAS